MIEYIKIIGCKIMYTDKELLEIRKAIYEYTAEQLMWQVLYINCAALHSPNLNAVRNKLLALPRYFELIMLNTVNTPVVQDLIHVVYEENRLFVDYVDSIFNNGTDTQLIKQKIDENVIYIAKYLNKINPQWGISEWLTLINHQMELINSVIEHAKKGNYETWAEVLPFIRKIEMDIAEYLSHGISGLLQKEH